MGYKNTASFLVSALFVATSSVNAVEVSGTVDINDPLASDVGAGWCDPSDRVEVHPFQVSTTGTYGFTNLNVTGGNGGGGFFVQINPTAEHSYTPLINADTYGMSPVAAAPSGVLTAGSQYYFAAITACDDSSIAPVMFSVILSGDGDVVIVGDYALSDAVPSLQAVGASLTAASRSLSLLVHGAHSRPLSRLVSEGEKTFWTAGDWGKDNHGSRDGTSKLAEVGIGYNHGPAQVNVSLGKTWADQDLLTAGSLDADGKYLMIEGIIPIPQVNKLYATLGAHYSTGDAKARRGYQVAAVQNFSTGNPDTKAWGVRARLDWQDLKMVSNTSISPFIDLSYTRSTIDAYTESGGDQPAQFNRSTDSVSEVRIGVNSATPIKDSKFDFVSTIEGIHRFSGSAQSISGTLINLSTDFDIDGEEYDQNWLRLGLGVEGELGEKGKVSLMLNGTTEGETASAWVAASYQVRF